MAKKLNGHMGWLTALVIAVCGWAYSLGYQAQTINANEKQIESKANKEVVEEGFRRLDEKLDMIINQIQNKE